MKTISFVSFFCSFLALSFAQDTVFTTRNPDGLIVSDWKKHRKMYYLQPIDSTAKLIKLNSRHVKEIHRANGEIELNKEFTKYKDYVLPTNPTNGYIELSKKLNNENIDKTQVSIAIDSLIQYDVFLKKSLTHKDEYEGRFEVYSDFIYFIFKIDQIDSNLYFSLSNFKKIRKSEAKLWLTPEQLNDKTVRVQNLEEYYYANTQSNKLFFERLTNKINQIEKIIQKVFNSSIAKEQITKPKLFNDTIITSSGVEMPVHYAKTFQKKVFFYSKTNGEVFYNKIDEKNIYLLKRYNEEEKILSHKRAKREGDYKIRFRNSFFLDYIQGVYSNYSYYIRSGSSSSNYTKIKINNASTYSFRFGYKHYFFSKTPRYSLGLQLTIRPSIHLSGRQVITFDHLIGYSSVYRINERIGIEANLNFGISLINLEKGYDLSFISFNKNVTYSNKYGFATNPEIKLRIGNFSIGVDYNIIGSLHNEKQIDFKNFSLQTWSASVGINF